MLFSVLVSLCYQCQTTHALKGAKPPAIFWLPLVPQTLLLPPPFENLPFTTPLFLCFQPLIHTNRAKSFPLPVAGRHLFLLRLSVMLLKLNSPGRSPEDAGHLLACPSFDAVTTARCVMGNKHNRQESLVEV